MDSACWCYLLGTIVWSCCRARPESNNDEIWCSMLGSPLMRGEGKLSKNTKTHPASCLLWLAGISQEEEKKERGGGGGGACLISASVPCACQSNILKQHMQGFATANYPALGTGTEKHLRRTIKRAWLVVRAVSKCWQIVIFNEYTALEWPIKRSLSEHCSFVQSINFLCNSQISCNETAIKCCKGKKLNQFIHLFSILSTASSSQQLCKFILSLEYKHKATDRLNYKPDV